jgi:hypothetical protein
MTKFFLVLPLAALLASCNPPPDFNPLKAGQFWALNFENDNYYKVTAELQFEGKKCVIWAEKGSGIDKAAARRIANVYDSVIHPGIVGAFSIKKNTSITFEGEEYQFDFEDILDYANRLAGKNNNKLTVLLLDIKDGFKDPKTDSYIAGYFYSGNFYPRDEHNSNGCDMIYVDTYPGLRVSPEQTYATFSHELQHLINFATSTLKRERAMDTWIDEGLSSQAEHIYYGKNIEEKCKRFSKDEYGTIAKGNNFFVWDNHREEPMAILDEYDTVYLFFRWLYLQADSELKKSIFLDIETAELSDHSVITSVAKKINPEWADWNTLLRSWLAANYYPENSDYGYKGDSYFHENIKVKPLTITSTPLYPGEGVYSVIDKPFSPESFASGPNIRYAGLDGNSSSIAIQVPFNQGVLLTYNANTDNKKTTAPETAYLTGVSPGVAASVSSPGSRMEVDGVIQTETSTGPYVIDARDYNSAGKLGRDK